MRSAYVFILSTVLGFLITASPAGFQSHAGTSRAATGARPEYPVQYIVLMALGAVVSCIVFRRATLVAPLGALVGQFLVFLIVRQPDVGWFPLIALPSYAAMAFIPAGLAVGIVWTYRPNSWPRGN